MKQLTQLNHKGLFIFDKDDTITDTKSPLEANMARLLEKLLSFKQVIIISGSSWPIFQSQIIAELTINSNLSSLGLMPASGSQYFTYSAGKDSWTQSYDHSINTDDYLVIKELLLQSTSTLPSKYQIDKVYSDQVENRFGQITLSALGQTAPKHLKKAWDPDRIKRQILAEYLIPKLPNFDVKIGGSTSIDITKKGINKEFGVLQALAKLRLNPNQAVYFGDSLGPNGNDAIVKNISDLDTIAVKDHHKTFKILENYLSN